MVLQDYSRCSLRGCMSLFSFISLPFCSMQDLKLGSLTQWSSSSAKTLRRSATHGGVRNRVFRLKWCPVHNLISLLLALSDHLTLASTWICRMVCFWECSAIIWPVDPSGFFVGSIYVKPWKLRTKSTLCLCSDGEVLLQGVNWIIDGWESMMERDQKTYICICFVYMYQSTQRIP